ncbi:MAG TPA: sigma-70 family RNA polymerase sigma factor [Abditibacteriaceae bacterium]
MAKSQGDFSHTTDDKLVIAALLGDLQAFDELVRRYRSAVTAVAQQVVASRDVAEEVAQESFLLAFKELPQLEDVTRFAGWLCAIARHRARRVAAREGRSEPHEPSTLDIIVLAGSTELGVQPADEPAHELARKAEQSEVAGALAQMPPDYQIALRLRYYEEWPVQRIATFLSIPVSTVKWRLHHGRELMRRHLNKQAEEDCHERDQPKSSRNSASARRFAADYQHCQGVEPDRLSGKGQPQFGAAIQPHPASTRRERS